VVLIQVLSHVNQIVRLVQTIDIYDLGAELLHCVALGLRVERYALANGEVGAD